jgi:hypothetical protein
LNVECTGSNYILSPPHTHTYTLQITKVHPLDGSWSPRRQQDCVVSLLFMSLQGTRMGEEETLQSALVERTATVGLESVQALGSSAWVCAWMPLDGDRR